MKKILTVIMLSTAATFSARADVHSECSSMIIGAISGYTFTKAGCSINRICKKDCSLFSKIAISTPMIAAGSVAAFFLYVTSREAYNNGGVPFFVGAAGGMVGALSSEFGDATSKA